MMNNKKELKEFKIPVSWEVCGEVIIEAENLESAIAKAFEIEKSEGLPLPTDSEYIDGSFKIDDDIDFAKYINRHNM